MEAPKFKSQEKHTPEAEGFGLSDTTLAGAQLKPIEDHPAAANDAASGFADTSFDFPHIDGSELDEPPAQMNQISGNNPIIPDAANATLRPTSSISEPNPLVMTDIMRGVPILEVDGLRPQKVEQPPVPGETQVTYDDKLAMVVKRAEKPSFLRRLFGGK